MPIYNLNYELKITTTVVDDNDKIIDADEITIKYPITITARIKKSLNGGKNNTCDLEVKGLSSTTMSKLFKDRTEYKKLYTMELLIDSRDGLHREYMGDIQFAYLNSKSDATEPNFVIASQSGFNAVSTLARVELNGKATLYDIFKEVINYTPNMTLGNLSPEVNNVITENGYSDIGNPLDILTRATEGRFYIDDNAMCMINSNEITDDDVVILNAKSGLLDIPQRIGTYVVVNLLYIGGLKIGQQVEVSASRETYYNGLYKVSAISHDLTISGSVANSATTTLELVQPEFFVRL